MIDFDAFNAEIISTAAFGEEVTWIPVALPAGWISDPSIEGWITNPATGEGFLSISGGTIVGVPDNGYAAVQGIGIVGVESSAPSLLCLSSDVISIARGDSIVRGTTTYYVMEKRPSGDGLTHLILSRDA